MMRYSNTDMIKQNPMFRFLYFFKNETYPKRLICYLGVYFGLNYFYPFYTAKFFHFQILIQDKFFLSLFPTLLLMLVVFRWSDMKKACFPRNQKQKGEIQSLSFLLLALILLTFPFGKLFGELPKVVSPLVNTSFLLVFYAQLVLGNFFVFLGIFGAAFLKKFRGELLFFLGTVALYIGATLLVEYQWRILSHIILTVLGWFFSVFHIPSTIDPQTFFVQLQAFKVFVGPTCSGVYSMATFLFLFFASIMVLKKQKRVYLLRAALVLLIGLLSVFLLNIVRVAIILLIGAYISKELALQLFHEYLSALFFMLIFLFFLYKLFPLLLYPSQKNQPVLK